MPEQQNDKYHYLDKISCQTEVNLQIVTPVQAIRLKTRLIGVDPNMSVIVAMGSTNDWFAAKQYIREGQKVIVRIINTEHPDGSLIAFQSNIQKLMSVAGRWLLIDYPKKVQQLALREHKRLPVHISATLLNPETQKECSHGHLNDLSIHSGAFVGDVITDANKDKKYLLQVEIDGEKKSVGIIIKNTSALEGDIKYGFMIEGETGSAKTFISALLGDSLLNS